MEVKDFSGLIALAADENAKGRGIKKSLMTAIEMIGTLISSQATYSFLGNPLYHASGAFSYTVNRIADNYSSYQVCKLNEDPRFKEYGLEKYSEEENHDLPRQPSRKDLFNKKIAIKEIGFGILSTVLPPIGHGISIGAPLIYENNWAVKNEIKKEFEIGDYVKKMIENDVKEEDVRQYLLLLIDKKKNVK